MISRPKLGEPSQPCLVTLVLSLCLGTESKGFLEAIPLSFAPPHPVSAPFIVHLFSVSHGENRSARGAFQAVPRDVLYLQSLASPEHSQTFLVVEESCS